MKIGAREIGPGHPVLVVAESGINHNGSLDTALAMVHAAKEAGADAFKVGCFAADCFVTARAVWKGESQRDLFKRYELSRDTIERIAEECRKVGLTFFGTPDCVEHARWLVEAGAPAIKIGSYDLTNTPLIKALAKTYRLPMILSTGMATPGEIESAIDAATDHLGAEWDARTGELISDPADDIPADVAVLYCCSVYPAPLSALRLEQIRRIKGMWGATIVGFSDHTEGHEAAVMATQAGAQIIEKHFTLDKTMDGPDHQWSADPVEFAALVRAVRQAHWQPAPGGESDTEEPCECGRAGCTKEPELSAEEVAMRVTARRSIVAARSLPEGHVLTESDIAFKRPGDGLEPGDACLVVGKTLKRALAADDLITEDILC